MTGREYHYACCLLSPYQLLPDICNPIYFAPRIIINCKPISLCVGFRCLYHSAHGVSITVAYAHHDNNRNVFGEWVFDYQSSYPFTKRKTGERICFLHLFPHLNAKIHPCLKNFLIFLTLLL